MHRRLQDFHKTFDGLKKFSPQTNKNKDLKAQILDNAGALFHEKHYIYKERYEEKKR